MTVDVDGSFSKFNFRHLSTHISKSAVNSRSNIVDAVKIQ